MEAGSNEAFARPKPPEWVAHPMKELMRLAWPIAVSMLSYSVMTLVDTLFVGWLGPAQLAGVGLAGVATFTLICFGFGLLRGTKVLVSQAVGAGESREIGSHLGAGLGVAVVLGVVALALGQAGSDLLPWLTATEAAGEAAQAYFGVRMLSAPAVLVYVALREARYAQGDARSPMVVSVVANVVNILLDYLLIFGLELGVAGAAWASVVAQVLEGVLLLGVQVRVGMDVSRTRLKHVRALLDIGLPTGLQFMLEVGSFAMLAGLISRMGELDMAAHQIALQVIHFSFLPAFAVAEAASVLTGQAVGANRRDLVRPVARLALLAATAYTGLCTVILVVASPLIVRGFTADPALAELAVNLLYVAAIFQVFDGANMVSRGALRGTGDVRYSAVIGILTAWVCTPPMTWLLGHVLGWGAIGGWIGLCIELIVGAGILWWRLERGGWHAAADRARTLVVEEEPAERQAIPASS